ncbi:hypothetical protein [Rhodocista pekingensis]|uniref:Transposase n=1 Tax=Rhodocista pekingensis TaxID=201185 RepID=A0ABW2KR07_9PROT
MRLLDRLVPGQPRFDLLQALPNHVARAGGQFHDPLVSFDDAVTLRGDDTGPAQTRLARRLALSVCHAAIWREEGNARPRPMGGDRHSHRREAHAAEILALIEAKPDTTLAEMAAHLERAHGVRAALSSVWRLLDRPGMSVRKNRARRRAAAA